MITTVNYILQVVAEGETYVFEYETNDVWETLHEFWRDDFDYLAHKMITKAWPVEVRAMDGGKVITTYHLKFEQSSFHHYYDHGDITLDEFAEFIGLQSGQESQKFKCAVVFGSRATRRYDEQDFEGLHEVCRDGDGSIVIREFDTEAERKAFIEGMEAGDGWCDYMEVDQTDIENVTFDDI